MYDVAIIGNGLVGLAAAMYAGRFELKTLVIGELLGGTITQTDKVENYPGFVSISSPELVNNFKEHADAYGVDNKMGRVDKVEKIGETFKLYSGSEVYESKTVILATGTTVRKLGLDTEEKLANRGVSYCALCDAAFFKGKTVAVVGGGDGAAVDALILTRFAEKIYILVRKDNLRAEPLNKEKLEKSDKIEIIYNTSITEFLGENMLEGVKLNNPYNSSDVLPIQGCFVAIGHIVNSEIASSLGVKLNDKKEIMINRESETNVPGVFSAGDCVDSGFKQAITGVAEGVLAAHSVYKFVSHK